MSSSGNQPDCAGLRGQTDFSLSINWAGAEDKPFYRALFVSAGRRAAVASKPFHGVAVISPEEFDRLLDELPALHPGPYAGPGPAYYVEVDAASTRCHVDLGFDQQTREVLRRMRDALQPANRQPITDILTRIGA